MPVERKPLFRTEILAPRAAAMPLDQIPEGARDLLRKWARLLSSPRADELKESELLPDYLSDVFYGVLGYRGPAASGERYTLSREWRVEVDGEFADAVLGELGAGRDRPLLALEGKGPNDPLDRPFAGRRMSAVDQGYRYAINLRDEVRLEDLDRQVEEEGFDVPRERLGPAPWTLEPSGVDALMVKIRARGTPLAEYAGVKLYYGIKTGLNEAFLIDTAARNRLIAEDPRSAELIKPYLRGQDVRRWRAEWRGQWMIFTRRGIDIERYPAVLRHLSPFRQQLEPKPPGWSGRDWPGRKEGNYAWYEIQDSIDYWLAFERPKIVYQDIVWESEFAFDEKGLYCNNTAYFIPDGDLWLLAVLNSPLFWWYSWRTVPHAKDEALRFFTSFLENLPIAGPADAQRETADSIVRRLLSLTDERLQARSTLIDWLSVEHEVAKLSRNMVNLLSLSADDLVAEVRKARGKKNPLSAAALKNLREEHARTIEPLAERLREAARLEGELSDLVCEAYGLTAEEIALMWQTAPPRMPGVSAR